MLSIFGSLRGKNLKDKQRSSYTRWSSCLCFLQCLRLSYSHERFSLVVTIDDQHFYCMYLKVLEQKEERIAPGTLYGSSHTYVTHSLILRVSSDQYFLLFCNCSSSIHGSHFVFWWYCCRYVLGAQDKAGPKRVSSAVPCTTTIFTCSSSLFVCMVQCVRVTEVLLWLCFCRLIFSKTRSLIKWMSPYNLRNWRLWMMYWQPSKIYMIRIRVVGTMSVAASTSSKYIYIYFF